MSRGQLMQKIAGGAISSTDRVDVTTGISEMLTTRKWVIISFVGLLSYDKVITFYSIVSNTGELGYDGPLYLGLLSMTDIMLGPSPMHIKYVSYMYVYDGFCI